MSGMVVGLVAVFAMTVSIGCTSTASKPLNAFQPRPFQASQNQQMPFGQQQNYSPQQAFYSPFATQAPAAVTPSQGYTNYPTPGYSQNNLGLDLQNSQQYQAGYQPRQPSPWSNWGLPNVRSFNPLGFAGTTC